MAAGSAASPLEAIANGPMRFQQYAMVALCCLINVTEGYDIVSLAYAAPVIGREWGTPAELMGLVFSAAAIGVALGAFFLAPLADRFGRRAMMLAALIAITVSHAFSAVNHSVYVLMGLRLLMGFGLGVLVVSLNIMVAEYSNNQRRNFMLGVLHSGFTVGMMLGGLMAALVLEPFGWRAIFIFGTAMNAVLVALLIPFFLESPSFLIAARPNNALARLNKILGRLGHAALSALPAQPEKKNGPGIGALLGAEMRNSSLLIWLVALSYAVVGYFLMNWKPTVLVDAGLTPTQASWGGVLEGFLGIAGHIVMGVLARNGGEGRLTAIFFVCLGVSLVLFGNLNAPPLGMILMGGMLKFFTVGAYTGIFLVAVSLYSPQIRSLGLGFFVGFTRIGAIIGPLLGGLVLGADIGRPAAFALFAGISLIPAIAMFILSRRNAASTAQLATATA